MSTIVHSGQDDLRERLGAVLRHQRLIALVTGAAVTASILFAFLLPPTYQSAATILIEQQEIPQDLVRSTITSFADQRVRVISQRVMTSQNLQQIIERYDLYPKLRKTKPREVLLKQMRDDVHMQMISADVIDPRSGRPTRANIAFSVAYDSRSGELAYKVANELTSLYLNENSSSRTKTAEQAATFMKEEGDRLSAEIAGLDAKLAEFKSKHSESLPELTQLNMAGTERIDTELRDVQNRLGTLNEQRLLMEAQLAQLNPSSTIFSDTGQRILSPEERLKAARSQVAGLSAKYSPDHPDVLAAKREVAGLEKLVNADTDKNDITRQIDATRGELAAARERYSPDHPDVRRLERQLEQLEQTLAKTPGDYRPASNRPDNPAYIQVKGQLEALLAERDTLIKKEGDLRAKLAEYESRLAQAPEVERTYRGMMRDSDNARARYQEIRAKQMEAEVSQNLETERKGEKFTLIEPPLPPEQPIRPRRGLILVMGLILSVALGFGVAWLRESAGGAVRGPGDLRRLLSVPPLASVPTIVTQREIENRRRVRRISAAAAGASLVVAVVLFHFLIMPLDVFWDVFSRRFGI